MAIGWVWAGFRWSDLQAMTTAEISVASGRCSTILRRTKTIRG